MATTLSRHELYELVWSQPRTALAQQLGVSDVAIGKHCKKARIPAPPAGYWARAAAGAESRRQPMPMRLPGQANAVLIGEERWRYVHAVPVAGDPLQPPAFCEEVDQQVSFALKQVGKVTACRDLEAPDPALARVLAAEARRRLKAEGGGWEKPLFDTPAFQRQLRMFNSLARALTPLYGKHEVRPEEEWIRGIGTVHRLVLNLDFGAVTMNLRVEEPSPELQGRERKKFTATTLSVGSVKSPGGVQEWMDGGEGRLEKQLPAILEALLRRAELTFRAHLQLLFEERLKAAALERAEEERRAQAREAARLAAIEAQREKVRHEITAIARRRRTAEDIRATVEALRAHPEAQAEGRARFDAWSAHALQVADHMDPLRASLDEVLGSFHGQI